MEEPAEQVAGWNSFSKTLAEISLLCFALLCSALGAAQLGRLHLRAGVMNPHNLVLGRRGSRTRPQCGRANWRRARHSERSGASLVREACSANRAGRLVCDETRLVRLRQLQEQCRANGAAHKGEPTSERASERAAQGGQRLNLERKLRGKQIDF